MSDRELLEAAAKAAGIEYRPESGYRVTGLGATGMRHLERWNPLTDDGDNRRLQIKLNLGLVPQEEGDWVCITYDSEGDEVVLAVDADPNRAVTRAAAEIGRARDGGEMG